MAEDSVFIDVKLAPGEDDNGGDTVYGTLDIRVSDEEGNPFPEATITVSALETDYRDSKPAEDHGMSQTFEDVPMPANVDIAAPGYQSVTVEVTAADLGGGDIRRGW